MSPRNPTLGILDPVLEHLVAALRQACEEYLKIERGVFAIAMAMDRAGQIDVFPVSVMDSYEWFELQVEVDGKLDDGLADGRFRAVGNALNISYENTHEPHDVPVLAIRVRRTPDQPIDIRVPYQRLPDATIRFGQDRLVANQEGDPLN